jgi:hypothetical protein
VGGKTPFRSAESELYEEGEDGWVVASIPEVPGAHGRGKTRGEARANVIDALRGLLELRFGEYAMLGGFLPGVAVSCRERGATTA